MENRALARVWYKIALKVDPLCYEDREAAVILCGTRLREVNMDKCLGVTDVGLARIDVGCSKLENLSLKWCLEISDLGFDLLCKKCLDLKVLDMSYVKMNERDKWMEKGDMGEGMVMRVMREASYVQVVLLKINGGHRVDRVWKLAHFSKSEHTHHPSNCSCLFGNDVIVKLWDVLFKITCLHVRKKQI